MVSRFAIPTLAALAVLTTIPAARAADMPLPPPVAIPEMSGWYLRGDIGFSNQNVGSLFNVNYADFTSVTNIDKSFDAAPLFGLGIGYTVNNWLRFDVTGEYRGNANFHGFDIGAIPTGGFIDDRYTGSKSEWTFLFNGYVDLGTWYNITPFVGAGVGVSRNTISQFRRCLSLHQQLGGMRGQRRQRCLWRHREHVELRLGAARRSGLQSVAKLHGRTRLPLYRPRQCEERRSHRL